MTERTASLRRRLVQALWLGLGLGTLAAAYLLYQVRGILAPFVLALLLAYLLEPAVSGLVRRGLPRVPAILLLYLAVALVLFVFIWFLVPTLVQEAGRFAQRFPAHVAEVRGGLLALQERYRAVAGAVGLRASVDQVAAAVQTTLQRQLDGVARLALALPRALLAAGFAPLVAFYILKDLDLIKRRVIMNIPAAVRPDVLDVLHRLDRVIGGFVRGQLMVAASIGILVGTVCSLLGLRYAVLIGVVAGLADVIPYFGPVVGAIPAIAAGFAISPLRALQVALAIALVQQLENAVISPKLLGDRVGLHPVLVMFVILAGGHWAGVIGMLLAVPAAALLRVLWCFGWEKLLAWRERMPVR